MSDVKVRISAEGGGQLKAELVSIGQAGDQAFKYLGTSMQHTVDQSTNLTRANKSAADSAVVFAAAIRKEETSLDALKTSIDPAYAALKRYEAQIAQVRKAERLGLIGGAESAALKARSKEIYDAMDHGRIAMDNFGKASANNTYVFRNLAYQLNQIGQQGAVTGDFLGAMAIQVPDMLSAFGSLPLVLAGGAFALGASFLPQLIGVTNQVKQAKSAIEEFDGALDAYKTYAATALKPTEDLRKEFGKFGEEIRSTAKYMATVAASQAVDNLNKNSQSLLGGISGAAAALDEYQAKLDNLQRIQKSGQPITSEQLQTMKESVAVYGDAAETAAEKLGLTTDQVGRLSVEMKAFQGAKTLQATYDASTEVLHSIEKWWPEATKLPPEIAKFADGMKDVQDRSAKALKLMEDMSKTDIAGAFDAATAAAARLQQMVAVGLVPPVAMGKGPNGENQNLGDPTKSSLPRIVMPPMPTTSSKSGGHSFDKGKSDAERLFDQTRTAAEKYDAEVAHINELHKKFGSIVTDDVVARAMTQLDEKFATSTKYMTEWGKFMKVDVKNAIVDLVATGKNGFGDLAESIKRAAVQMILFNEGMFAIKGGSFHGLLGGLLGFEKGGVFDAGHVQAFADGGVVSSPTYFGMTSGLGKMGEAGPEAIMPLTRIGGKLGIRAIGGNGGGHVHVSVSLDDNLQLSAKIEQISGNVSTRVTDGALRTYDTQVLPTSVRRVTRDPRKVN